MEAGVRGRQREAEPLLFGTILFLASETLFFGGLFAAYFTLRAQTSPWPPVGDNLDIIPPLIGTALLLTSSFTLEMGIFAARRGALSRLKVWTLATMSLGILFLGAELYDWMHLDFGISTDAYGTMYFALTGFHLLHVVAGLLLMTVLLGRLGQGAYRDGKVAAPEAISYYWHFVDAVWVFLFLTIYVLR